MVKTNIYGILKVARNIIYLILTTTSLAILKHRHVNFTTRPWLQYEHRIQPQLVNKSSKLNRMLIGHFDPKNSHFM